jgi:hypothetical protein
VMLWKIEVSTVWSSRQYLMMLRRWFPTSTHFKFSTSKDRRILQHTYVPNMLLLF